MTVPYSLIAVCQVKSKPIHLNCKIRYELLHIYLVYSHNVISDSTFMVPAGGWVRSTFLIALHNQCIFETPNTNYILVGNGREVKISLEEYYLLLNLR